MVVVVSVGNVLVAQVVIEYGTIEHFEENVKTAM